MALSSDTPPDDPRFEWIEVRSMDGTVEWIPGECQHIQPEPVHAYPTEELVAWLCPDCDRQLPADGPWVARARTS